MSELPDISNAVCTVEQAAAWFGVNPSTVRTWLDRYQIPSMGKRVVKIYRFVDLVNAHRRARGLPPVQPSTEETP